MAFRVVLATDDGLLEVSDRGTKRICCRGASIMDALIREDWTLVCTEDGVVEVDKGMKIVEGSCWRVKEVDNQIVASVEGPRLFSSKGEILGDYTGTASERGWHFPHGPAHVTDLVQVGEMVFALVEEGDLLVGKSVRSLSPSGFREDQHNLLYTGSRLLIATASGVYTSEDLKSFSLSPSSRGYFHALEQCGDLILGQVMRSIPLMISRDFGLTWESLPYPLPRPTFGQTSVKCVDERRAVYANESVYLVDLYRGSLTQLSPEVPSVNRVIEVHLN